MSGVLKSVGKIFKKVAKVVKKVLPVILAAAAIYFTAGAALGVAGTAGGWGSAVSGMVSNMGATGMLSNVLTGAITQAGYGAAAGGALSLISGGDVMKGLQGGALTGAVTGGVMGGLGLQTDPFKGIGESSDAITGSVGTETLGAAGPGADTLGVDLAAGAPTQAASELPNIAGGETIGVHPVDQLQNVPATGAAPTMPPATTVGSPAVSNLPENAVSRGLGGGGAGVKESPGFFQEKGWLERNQELAGGAIKGLGQGLVSYATSDDGDYSRAMELGLQRDEATRQAIAANYGDAGTPVPGYRKLAAPTGNPTPTQRFDPKSYQGAYRYNPQTGTIDFVPTAQTA